MNIVGSTYFLRRMRNLSFFTLDMGLSRKIVGTDKFRKLDEFSLKYFNIYGNDILKFGRIGERIMFYEDVRIPMNKLIIFKNDDIYEIEYTEDELTDLQDYILGVMMRIDNYEESERNLIDTMTEEYSTREMWIAEDDKNKGKAYLIDQRIDKESYRKEFLKVFETDIKNRK